MQTLPAARFPFPLDPFQLDAIGSIVELFTGQPQAAGIGSFSVQDEGLLSLALTDKGIANRLTLSAEQLLDEGPRLSSNEGK